MTNGEKKFILVLVLIVILIILGLFGLKNNIDIKVKKNSNTMSNELDQYVQELQ